MNRYIMGVGKGVMCERKVSEVWIEEKGLSEAKV